jgi:MoaA/NifB/PqqE/SkfB family radical SAM enzyme
VSLEDIAPHVDYVNIPLDGASQETVGQFRRGRANLFEETRTIAGLLRDAGVAFGYNTVANTSNIHELKKVRDIAMQDGATEWQVFEYDSDGPNPSNKKEKLRLPGGAFKEATTDLDAGNELLKITCKDLEKRNGIYFLVDDGGNAWKPAGEGLKHSLGHVTMDRVGVLAALRHHVDQFRKTTVA